MICGCRWTFLRILMSSRHPGIAFGVAGYFARKTPWPWNRFTVRREIRRTVNSLTGRVFNDLF